MYKGETSYLIDDLVEYGDYDFDYVNDLVHDEWINANLIIIKNVNYSIHDIEYIVVNTDTYDIKTPPCKMRILNKYKKE